jgi:hypothetical protein
MLISLLHHQAIKSTLSNSKIFHLWKVQAHKIYNQSKVTFQEELNVLRMM